MAQNEALNIGVMMPFAMMGPPSADVFWVDMSGRDMQEPFFEQTVHDARLAGARVIRTHRDVLQEARGLRPSGFLFHVSRCGSTLLMNMLKQSPRVTGVSEPAILDYVMASTWNQQPWYSTALLAGAVSALGQRRTGAEEFYVLKFKSEACLVLPRILGVFPDVPKVFLYRDPLEVLVANMEQHPAQSWIYMNPFVGIGRTELTEVNTPLENCAIALSRKYENALNNAAAFAKLVNYSEISEEVFRELLDIFGVRVSEADIARMMAEKSRNAKNRGRAFSPDGNAKAAKASKKVRAAAEKYLGEPYARLEALRVGTPRSD
jgi:hypothetical protein